MAVLEKEASDPNFWDSPEEAQRLMQELGQLKEKLGEYEQLAEQLEELEALLQLAQEESHDNDSQELLEEARILNNKIERLLEKKERSMLFQGSYDKKNAIVSIHPGAGGLEAQDWAEMLLRMYTRWGEKRGYEVEILDLLPGDEAGIKSATLTFKGEKAYGYLQSERGVHRLVRISPFDTGGRRHTSFASVDVLPEAEVGIDVAIDPDELRIDTFRARGAGGQHVNTTDSAVRITHLPTGIVAQCQNERSQHSNKERAMHILVARMADISRQKHQEELNALRGEQKEIAWGSQIRSYTFHPYSLVKDHRTGVEVGNIISVMDGEIDLFLEAFLRYNANLQTGTTTKGDKED